LEKYAVVRQYRKAVREAGSMAPTLYGMEGFLEAKLLVYGLQKALVDSREVSREAIAAAFDRLGTADLGGYTVKYGPGDRTTAGSYQPVTAGNCGRFQ
jgi:ABC-type branched-subunit amino acid transport system substrate-binding protein